MQNKQAARSQEAAVGTSSSWASGRPHDHEALSVLYNDPEQQLVDFFSRFGVWWDPDSPSFGIDHGGISSQREGKHFMAPLARLTVLDVDSGEVMFDDATAQPSGYAWGFVQEGERGALRLRTTVAYADLDVVAVKVEIENTGEVSRQLRLCLNATAVDGDLVKSVDFHQAPDGVGVIAIQTSTPTSRFQLRPEPEIDIVSGWRTDFDIARHDPPHDSHCGSQHRGFYAAGDVFSLLPSATRVFSLYVSAASSDSGTGKGLIPLVRQRLTAHCNDVDEVIRAAQKRWRSIFAQLPDDLLKQRWRDYLGTDADDALTERTPPLVHRAMMILLRNTIRPQPEQGYGEVMGTLRGTFPCRFSYEGFWMWDSAFQALGFSEWDLELAKENVRIILLNQSSDNGLRMLHPDSKIASAQPPLFSWVAMEIYEKERKHDEARAREFLEEVYPELVLWNDWWFRHRDRNGNGLCEWGNNLESGWDDSPRWDNSSGAAGWNNDHGARVYAAVDLNAYLIKDMRSLGRMATALFGVAAARSWDEKADRLSRLVVNFLYDPDDNIFYDTDYVTGEPHKLVTPASLLPLWAGVPLPQDRVRAMIETYLLSPDYFYGEYPFPTVAYNQAAHDASGASGYWRGPVWLNIAYFMIELLAWHGFPDEAHDASRRILEMVRRAGLHENYNSKTGQPGVNSRMDYSWSAAMAITIAMGDLTRGRPPQMYQDSLALPPVQITFRVRDRKIYGRGKEASIHVANRTGDTVSGMLRFSLPGGWKLQTHDAACGPEQGWTVAIGELPFELGPHARYEQPVRFVLPSLLKLQHDEYALHVHAVAREDRTVQLGETALRLIGPAMEQLPWLTASTATTFQKLLHQGTPFRWGQDGQQATLSDPGLVGLLNGERKVLGLQAPALHLGQRDLIKHALKLVQHLPMATTLRRALESLLAESISPQVADEQARELLETVVQQTRDLKHNC